MQQIDPPLPKKKVFSSNKCNWKQLRALPDVWVCVRVGCWLRKSICGRRSVPGTLIFIVRTSYVVNSALFHNFKSLIEVCFFHLSNRDEKIKLCTFFCKLNSKQVLSRNGLFNFLFSLDGPVCGVLHLNHTSRDLPTNKYRKELLSVSHLRFLLVMLPLPLQITQVHQF